MSLVDPEDLRVLLPSSSQFSDSMFSELAPRSKRFVLVPLQPHLGKIQLFADTLKGLSENEMIYGSQIYLLANTAKQWGFSFLDYSSEKAAIALLIAFFF